MMAKNERIALKADPNDPEDGDVTEAALEQALAERRQRKVGRPAGTTTSDRQAVSLRLPKSVIDHFKADGPGWQTRVVAGLERLVLLDQAWFDEEVMYRRPDGSTESVTLRRAVEKFIDLPPEQRDRADVDLQSAVTLKGGVNISGTIGPAMIGQLADLLEPHWRH